MECGNVECDSQIEMIKKIANCSLKFMFTDLRFLFLRLKTIKKCPHMLRSDYEGAEIEKIV